MGRVIETGVTGGAPNLPGSFTAAARPLPQNVDWQEFGTSHTPENCGFPWVWQRCTEVAFVPAQDAINEQQHINIIDAIGGTFAFSFDGEVGDPVIWDDILVDVQAGIDSIPGVAPGDITVSGTARNWDFDFAGNFAGVNVPQLTIVNIDLVGDPEVFVVATTQVDGQPEILADTILLDKPLNPGVDAVDFKPFLVEYNSQSCPGGVPVDHEALADRARRGLAVRVGNAIDHALSSSTPDGQPNPSPNLPESATDITPAGGPSNLVNTIAGLIQDAYACGATGELWIHAPAWTLPYFLDHTQLTQIGNVYKLGPHTVIFDQGYANEPPTGGDAAGVGEAWIYVSGPFEYATGPIQILDDTTGGVSPRLNRANVIAAQLAIYRFDPCCIFAARTRVC